MRRAARLDRLAHRQREPRRQLLGLGEVGLGAVGERAAGDRRHPLVGRRPRPLVDQDRRTPPARAASNGAAPPPAATASGVEARVGAHPRRLPRLGRAEIVGRDQPHRPVAADLQAEPPAQLDRLPDQRRDQRRLRDQGGDRRRIVVLAEDGLEHRIEPPHPAANVGAVELEGQDRCRPRQCGRRASSEAPVVNAPPDRRSPPRLQTALADRCRAKCAMRRFDEPIDPSRRLPRAPRRLRGHPRRRRRAGDRAGRARATSSSCPAAESTPGRARSAALHRECLEETGWRIAVIRRLGAWQRFACMPEYGLLGAQGLPRLPRPAGAPARPAVGAGPQRDLDADPDRAGAPRDGRRPRLPRPRASAAPAALPLERLLEPRPVGRPEWPPAARPERVGRPEVGHQVPHRQPLADVPRGEGRAVRRQRPAPRSTQRAASGTSAVTQTSPGPIRSAIHRSAASAPCSTTTTDASGCRRRPDAAVGHVDDAAPRAARRRGRSPRAPGRHRHRRRPSSPPEALRG